MTPHPDATARPATEDRLRAALTARAALLAPHDLRPADPPRGHTWGTRRLQAAALAAAAVAAAVVLVTLLPTGGNPRTPVTPAATPSADERPPAPPATPAPAPPSPTSPSVVPPRPLS
ncbi:hypothetical protein AB0424_30280 [Streptomyces sp. NPDC051180]|uniref:hypothetical protein n=1 Tax=Streptomyces sp. NPDC051180 TaxID=3155797 RepID=UPI00344F9B65